MNDAWLLNVGNTHARLARLAEGKLLPARQVPTAALLAGETPWPELSGEPKLPVVAACVVPAARERLAKRHPTAHWLGTAFTPGLNLSLLDASTLGADRLANAIAACHEMTLPAVILDCGTALTTVVVDVHRRLLGGAIMPGRALLRRALRNGTAQLPDLPLADERPAPIGRDTRGAILAGVDLGVLGAVGQVLEATRRELGLEALSVTAVGGDAPFFTRHLERVVPGPADFTLRGVACVARAL